MGGQSDRRNVTLIGPIRKDLPRRLARIEVDPQLCNF